MSSYIGESDPDLDISEGDTLEEIKSKNYKMLLKEEVIKGYVDELEAMKQVVYKILSTERYVHLIYTWNYGVELRQLFGKPVDYVCPEIERLIKAALFQDNRINNVYSFTFDKSKKGVVSVEFIVETIYGEMSITKEVAY